MKKILISEDAFGDLNDGFLFYDAQEYGLGDYFTACLRADIEGFKVTAGIHREIKGFHRLLSRLPSQSLATLQLPSSNSFSFIEVMEHGTLTRLQRAHAGHTPVGAGNG